MVHIYACLPQLCWVILCCCWWKYHTSQHSFSTALIKWTYECLFQIRFSNFSLMKISLKKLRGQILRAIQDLCVGSDVSQRQSIYISPTCRYWKDIFYFSSIFYINIQPWCRNGLSFKESSRDTSRRYFMQARMPATRTH